MQPGPSLGFRYTASVRHALTAWLALLLCCAAPSKPAVEDPPVAPDVLLVVLDTVRADRLSTYGYHRPTSPQLDAMAQAGVVFEDVTSSSTWTWPAHGSLFTGQPPWVHGAHIGRGVVGAAVKAGHLGALPLRKDLPTLAERFKAAGYRTVSLSANALLSPDLGLMRGFEDARFLPDHEVASVGATLAGEAGDAPLFLFLNFMGAHAPWNITPAAWSAQHGAQVEADTAAAWTRPYLTTNPAGLDLYRAPEAQGLDGFQRLQTGALRIPDADMGWVNDLYDGQVAVSDYLLHRVLGPWSAAHPDGIVAVVSDHGEYLGEHGLWEHGKTVYSEVVAVPMVVAAPGRLAGGQRVSRPVQLMDLYPTLLDLAGIESGAAGSLLPVIGGAARPGPIRAKAWSSSIWATRVGGRFAHDWRLIRDGQTAVVLGSDGTVERFNLSIDRAMRTDLHPGDPAGSQRLIDLAAVSFDEAPRADSTPVVLPKRVVERLRALGYVSD
jgi:arylsulfatase A-like enzyme